MLGQVGYLPFSHALEKRGPGERRESRPAKVGRPGARSCDSGLLPPTSVAALRAIGSYTLIRVAHLSEKWLRRTPIFPRTFGAERATAEISRKDFWCRLPTFCAGANNRARPALHQKSLLHRNYKVCTKITSCCNARKPAQSVWRNSTNYRWQHSCLVISLSHQANGVGFPCMTRTYPRPTNYGPGFCPVTMCSSSPARASFYSEKCEWGKGRRAYTWLQEGLRPG